MTDKQLALLLLNESLFFSGQKVFVVELVLKKELIDLLAFCVGPEIIIAVPTSYGLYSKATDTHLLCFLFYRELSGTGVCFTDSHLF